MNKKSGWTLAELMIAMTFVMVICGFMFSVFKPSQQKSKIAYFAALRNVQKGVVAVHDKNMANAKWDAGRDDRTIFYEDPTLLAANKDTFCVFMADAFSLKQPAVCTRNQTQPNATPNIVLSNGVEIYGLTSAPIALDTESEEGQKYSYKNILVDIDGPKGKNKLGIDRFPLRIYAVDDIVIPVNCGETEIYDWRLDGVIDNGVITLTDEQKNPYCKTGKDFTGARSDINFMLDEEVITYDTFKNKIIDKEIEIDDETGEVDHGAEISQESKMVAFSRSYAETVCGTFGGTKILSASECASYGFKIFTECTTQESCEKCEDVTPNICPLNTSGTQTNTTSCLALYNAPGNKNNLCFSVPHRHSAGMSAIVKGLMGGELDMD